MAFLSRQAALCARSSIAACPRAIAAVLRVPALGSCAPAVPSLQHVPVRFANSKAGGSTKNGRDSKPKYLGVKKYGGHWVEPGNIILRQRGQRYGIVDSTATVAFARDWSIYALKPGYVRFWFHEMKKKYFVEVVQSPPDSAVVEKYPIVRLKEWEVPELLKVPAETPISDGIRQQLVNHLKTIPASRLGLVLPKNKPAVGRVDEELWGKLKADGAAEIGAGAGEASATSAQ